MWFEVFSSGKHFDSSGDSRMYNNDDLDKIAFLYNERIETNPNDKAPVVKGHPKSDDPSFGWVEKLSRRGDKLVAYINIIKDDFKNELDNNSFKNISISLYDNLNLKHIGFLGAAVPAVKNLQKLEFSEVTNTNGYSDKSINDLITENQNLTQKIDILQKEKRLIEFRDYANELIENKNSVVSPGNASDLIDLLELTYQKDSDIQNYSENSDNFSFSQKLKNLLFYNDFSSLSKEIVIENKTNNENHFFGKNILEDRMDLHQKAITFLNEEPLLSYEEAISKAINFNKFL
jgi:hypothetical protein